MKRLYLVRHAKSSWDHPDLDDFSRPLNERGKRDASFMGRWLAGEGVKPDLIISSAAKRAMSTARKIADEIDYPRKKIRPEEGIYGAGPAKILEVLRNVEDVAQSLMIFGHNPTFTDVAVNLSGYSIETMPTCAVFCVDFDVDSWTSVSEGEGKFVSFDYPKKLR